MSQAASATFHGVHANDQFVSFAVSPASGKKQKPIDYNRFIHDLRNSMAHCLSMETLISTHRITIVPLLTSMQHLLADLSDFSKCLNDLIGQSNEALLSTVQDRLSGFEKQFRSVRKEIGSKSESAKSLLQEFDQIADHVQLSQAMVQEAMGIEWESHCIPQQIFFDAVPAYDAFKHLRRDSFNSQLEHGSSSEAEKEEMGKLRTDIETKKLHPPTIDVEIRDGAFESLTVGVSTGTLAISLRRILDNLLSNAARYGGQEANLELQWIAEANNRCQSGMPGWFRIILADNGEGILKSINLEWSAAEVKQRAEEILFGNGKETESHAGLDSSHHQGGNSTKQLVRELGGTIDFTTKGAGRSEGTEFIVHIPVRKMNVVLRYRCFPQEALSPDQRKAIQAAGIRVLVVDDQTVNLKHMERLLGRLPSIERDHYVFAKSRSEAFERARKLIDGAIPQTPADLPHPHASLVPPIILFLDQSLGNNETGEQIICDIKDYCNDKTGEIYKKVLAKLCFVSMTSSELMPINQAKMYHGFVLKPLNLHQIEHALYHALTWKGDWKGAP